MRLSHFRIPAAIIGFMLIANTTISPTMAAGGIESLEPAFQQKVGRVLVKVRAKGWQPKVAEGRRTIAEQREKVRRGVSKTMRSKHLCGIAADIIDKRYGWGGPAANTNFKFWKDLGAAAKSEGLVWGGDWRSFKDVAHLEEPRKC
ncbi:M15 family metallopeptidase [Funiculus sociatus GB2-M2]|uniref:M15 family metallopeptidase n=1 Tax=Funiculus sociatus TaxID=450527 RepID=UPI0032990CE8